MVQGHSRTILTTYMRCAQWQDRGILIDLARYHGLDSPAFDLLSCVAHVVAAVVHLRLPRLTDRRFNDETRKTLLIGWFNYHYDVIGQHIRNLVLKTESGETLGPHADEFTNWVADHPESQVAHYLNEEQ
jgi:hypothetical protein